MKVEQQQAKFNPVTITIENEQELKVFLAVFGAMTSAAYKAINYNTSELYRSLESIAERYGIACETDLYTTVQ